MGPVRKTFRRLFDQVYEPFRSTVLPAYSIPVSTSKALIRSFSSKLKTTSSPKASLSSHQKCAPTSATRSRYSSNPGCFSSIPVTTLSISSPKNSDRAASVPRLPSTTADSSVNALNSSYVATTKPLSIKTSKSLVPKSLAPLRASSCINSFVSESVSNGTKEVVDRDSYNSSLGNFSSFVTTKCFPTFLSFLVSFLALCYSSKLLLFYLVFLTFLIRYFLLTQTSCVVLILKFLIYIFLLILFSIRRYTNFQKRLNIICIFTAFCFAKS